MGQGLQVTPHGGIFPRAIEQRRWSSRYTSFFKGQGPSRWRCGWPWIAYYAAGTKGLMKDGFEEAAALRLGGNELGLNPVT